MPKFSGVPLPTPKTQSDFAGAGGGAKIAFLVSQIWTSNTSDDITGYISGSGANTFWIVNRIFASGQR